jgi:CDP-diacylglycerol--glycerol-3-phosphate 3-phosphatidyltransferase
MQRPERVVVTSLGLLLCGLLNGIEGFDALWCAAAPMILIAILANGTAIARILHVRKQMDGRGK